MTKEKREHNLPNIVFIYRDEEGYLIASDTVRDATDVRAPRFVGKYWLGQVDKTEFRVKRTKAKR